jgi:hypothetical protein
MRARWLASNTRSKRFSTLSMQSSTVTRAIIAAPRSPLLGAAGAGIHTPPAGYLSLLEHKRKGVFSAGMYGNI